MEQKLKNVRAPPQPMQELEPLITQIPVDPYLNRVSDFQSPYASPMVNQGSTPRVY